jgi:hypothetical protein
MKKLILSLIFSILCIGCSISVESKPIDKKLTDRIKEIEHSSVYRIIEIDGHQYMTSSYGGICHLESCPCLGK